MWREETASRYDHDSAENFLREVLEPTSHVSVWRKR